MRRTQAERREATRAKLAAAARKAFGASGFEKASLDQICAECGLTRGALHHHFGSKEGLLEVVVGELDAEMRLVLDRASEEAADLWTGFRLSCHAYLRQSLDPEYQQIVLRDAPAVLGEKMRQMDHATSIGPMTEALAWLMKEGRLKKGPPEALALMVNGALIDAALWIAAGKESEKRLEASAQALDLLLDGLEASLEAQLPS